MLQAHAMLDVQVLQSIRWTTIQNLHHFCVRLFSTEKSSALLTGPTSRPLIAITRAKHANCSNVFKSERPRQNCMLGSGPKMFGFCPVAGISACIS